jgi:hypothetical protein
MSVTRVSKAGIDEVKLGKQVVNMMDNHSDRHKTVSIPPYHNI